MSWTDERIATLTKMWESGATASQIADELGGVSRNAVIGKAHRLGLKARPSPVKATAPKPKSRAPEPDLEDERDDFADAKSAAAPATPSQPLPNPVQDLPRVVSVGPGGFLRQGPGD